MRGDRLRQIREMRDFSQKDLADRIGISDQQVYRYETNRSEPTGDVLMHLSQVLEVSVDWLLGLVEQPTQHVSEADLSPMERKLIQALREGRIIEATKAFAS